MEDEVTGDYLSSIGSIILQMLTPDIVIGIVLLLLLIILSAMVSGSEIAFFSLNDAVIEKITGSKKHQIKWLWSKPKKLLATILITNNFVNVAIIIIAAWLTNKLFVFQYPWVEFLVDVVVITSFLILFGELMPKILANIRVVGFCKIMSKPLTVLFYLFSPISNLLIGSTKIIDRRIRSKTQDISKEDLSEAIDYSAKINEHQQGDTKLLKGIVTFGEKEVKEIMKSRMDVVAIEESMKYPEIINIINEAGFSRYPVYQESFDKIVGLFHVKDMLGFLDSDNADNWKEIIRNAYFVPENKKINELLKEFQEKKVHFAIVVDEYGGTSGIVTLEDVIEEIVGEISDEFDEGEHDEYKKIKENVYEFEAKTNIIDFCRIVGADEEIFNRSKGDYDTIAGLILENEGRIPNVYDTIVIKNFVFKILEVDKRRIKKVRVIIDDEKAESKR